MVPANGGPVKTSFSVSAHINAAPDVLYRAWLSSEEHAKFTGSEADIDPGIGGPFTAWDGYIRGTTLEKEDGKRILQSWRTTEFPEGSPDSLVEVLFEEIEDGTEITINHSRIPAGQEDDYKTGWEEFYFQPMRECYSKS
jgi:activator of HSP90 ATPase